MGKLITIHVKLLAFSQATYSNYIFQNLSEPEKSFDRYISVIKLPNWEDFDLKKNCCGFLTYELANAGEEYYNNKTNKTEKYKYTANYLIKFINEDQKQEDINTKF